MSGYLYGIVNNRSNISPDFIERFKASHDFQFIDARDSFEKPTLFFSNQIIYNTPESKVPLEVSLESGDFVITGDLRIDNRKELIKELNLKENYSDQYVILECYKKWGENFAKQLRGAFVISLWDNKEETLILVRDQLGAKSAFFHQNGKKSFCYSTSLKALITSLPEFPEVEQEWVLDYFSSVTGQNGSSAYKGVFQIEPGQLITVNNNVIRKKWYFELNPTGNLKFSSQSECIEFIREKLNHSIQRNIRSDYPIGTELSGGLDSSLITALTTELRKDFKAEGYVFSNAALDFIYEEKPQMDERHYANSVVEFLGLNNHISNVGYSKSAIESYTEFIEAFGCPPEKNGEHALLGVETMKKARELGVRTILTGFGGDETLSARPNKFRRLSFLKDNNYIGYLKDASRCGKDGKANLKNVITGVKEDLFRNKTLRKKRSTVYNRRAVFLKKEFYKEDEVSKRMALHSKNSTSKYLEKQQLSAFKRGTISTRMAVCDYYAKTFGLEYRHPYLDLDLIEAYLSLNYLHKINSEITRPIIRSLSKGKVPELVLNRIGKTGNVYPSWHDNVIKTLGEIAGLLDALGNDKAVRSVLKVKDIQRLLKGDIKERFKKDKEIRLVLNFCIWFLTWNSYICSEVNDENYER